MIVYHQWVIITYSVLCTVLAFRIAPIKSPCLEKLFVLFSTSFPRKLAFIKSHLIKTAREKYYFGLLLKQPVKSINLNKLYCKQKMSLLHKICHFFVRVKGEDGVWSLNFKHYSIRLWLSEYTSQPLGQVLVILWLNYPTIVT